MSNSKAIGVAYSDPEFESLSVTGDSSVSGDSTFVNLSTTGTTSLGNAAADLVGMHGSTAVQGSALVAVGTSIPVAACATFGLTSTQLTAMVTALNSIIAVLQAKGISA
jgi:hypothetical protein